GAGAVRAAPCPRPGRARCQWPVGGTLDEPGADRTAVSAGHTVARRDSGAPVHLGQHRQVPRQEPLPEAGDSVPEGRGTARPRIATPVISRTGRAASTRIATVSRGGG